MKATILAIAGAFLSVIFTAVFFVLFIWFGWNWGVCRALPAAREIGLDTAVWFSLFLSAVGWFFKPAPPSGNA